jgi:hypothetical protein
LEEIVKENKTWPKLEKEEWGKIARRQLHKECKLKKEEDSGNSDEGEKSTVATDQIELAPPQIKAIYHDNLQKKLHLDKSHTIQAFETLDNLFQLIPGKANGGFM